MFGVCVWWGERVGRFDPWKEDMEKGRGGDVEKGPKRFLP